MLAGVLLATVTATAAGDNFAVPSIPASPASSPNILEFRLAAGTEWDTNAKRATGTGNTSINGDGVARLIAELGSSIPIDEGNHLTLGYVLGAKRFFKQSTEDLLVHNLTGSTDHKLSSLFSGGAFGSYRASRMRSGVRDYSLGLAGASVAVRPHDQLVGSVHASWIDFEYVPNSALSYDGPTTGLDVAFALGSGFLAGARGQYAWRDYSRTRDDTELLLAPRFAYRGKIRAAVDYILRVQRSTSDLENVTRHRFSATAALPMFFETTANISAALQIQRGSSTDPLLVEDDENQSYVQVGLSRKLGDVLAVELRYALFAIKFTTSGSDFIRQTFYAGLSYRLGD